MTKITPGARLRNFREKAGLSREALARQINASAGAIQLPHKKIKNSTLCILLLTHTPIWVNNILYIHVII